MRKNQRQPGTRGAALLLVIFAVAFVAVLSIAKTENGTVDWAVSF